MTKILEVLCKICFTKMDYLYKGLEFDNKLHEVYWCCKCGSTLIFAGDEFPEEGVWGIKNNE